MNKLIKIVLTLHIAILNNFAMASDCRESVVLIEKGTAAQCTGFLFSPEAEAQAASDSRDAKYYKLINEQLVNRQKLMQDQTDILDKRLKLYMDQSHELSKELNKRDRYDTWENIMWFSLGIIATGLAVSGAKNL